MSHFSGPSTSAVDESKWPTWRHTSGRLVIPKSKPLSPAAMSFSLRDQNPLHRLPKQLKRNLKHCWVSGARRSCDSNPSCMKLPKSPILTPRIRTPGEVNVAFLAQPLSKEQIAAMRELMDDVDDFVFGKTEIFWLCQCRQSDSKVTNTVIERKIAARSTIRRAKMLKDLSALLRGE